MEKDPTHKLNTPEAKNKTLRLAERIVVSTVVFVQVVGQTELVEKEYYR